MRAPEVTLPTSGLSLRRAALVAGLAYLLNPVTFAEGYAMPHLVAADPAQTAQNIAAHPLLFASAIASYLVSALGDIVLAWALYHLLAPVNKALSLLGSLLQLVYAAAWMAAIANLGLLFRLIDSASYAGQVSAAEQRLQTVVLLGSFHAGWGLALILFGLHLVVIGYLIAHSTYIPRWLGGLLFLTGWAWVVDSFGIYFYPAAHLAFLNAFFAMELVFMVWLLGWGWRLRQPLTA